MYSSWISTITIKKNPDHKTKHKNSWHFQLQKNSKLWSRNGAKIIADIIGTITVSTLYRFILKACKNKVLPPRGATDGESWDDSSSWLCRDTDHTDRCHWTGCCGDCCCGDCCGDCQPDRDWISWISRHQNQEPRGTKFLNTCFGSASASKRWGYLESKKKERTKNSEFPKR